MFGQQIPQCIARFHISQRNFQARHDGLVLRRIDGDAAVLKPFQQRGQNADGGEFGKG